MALTLNGIKKCLRNVLQPTTCPVSSDHYLARQAPGFFNRWVLISPPTLRQACYLEICRAKGPSLSVKKLKNTKEKEHYRKNKEIKISLHLKNISANIVPRFSKKSRASNRQWSKRTQNWPKMFAKCFSTTNSQRVMNFSHVAVWRTLSSSMTNWSRMFRPRFYVPYKNVPPINRLKA